MGDPNVIGNTINTMRGFVVRAGQPRSSEGAENVGGRG